MALGGLGLTAAPASAAPTAPVVDVDHTVAGTGGDVVLAWLPVAGATSYKVEVDTSDLFTAPLTWSATTAGLRATPTVPLAAGTTYWRVAAIDGTGRLNLPAAGGSPPYTWLVDGTPVTEPQRRRETQWQPPGKGFMRISVIDATGASESVSVRLQ